MLQKIENVHSYVICQSVMTTPMEVKRQDDPMEIARKQ